MSDEPRTYVRIDTGYGPPGRAEHPIELHGGDGDGVSRLTVEEAEALAGQLRSAAHAVRVLTDKRPSANPQAKQE